MVTFGDAEQEKRVEFLKRQEEEELAQILSRKYGVEYVDLSLVAINTDALRLIPEAQSRDCEAAAFGLVGKRLSLAVRAPENPKVKALVQSLEERGYAVTVFMASQESLKRGWVRYADLSFATSSKAGIFEISNEEVEELLAKIKAAADIASLISQTESVQHAYRITRVLEILLAGGIALDASDIHFEPEEDAMHLRYNLDGVLGDVLTLDHETYRLMLSRLKLLSGLKLNITNEAQDGRFSIKVKGDEIEIRTAVLPSNYGETVVLRLLNPKSIAVPLEELGIEPKLLARIEREVARPNGMILTTGPTSSGKTTTLYAFLKRVNEPGKKIITIEDPIEYHLPIVQTQVEKGYTFAEGLRSALRANPQVIMIGEIRDGEVAETAINAALTGHIVFTTLHTNDAAGTFPRLIAFGVNEKILSSAINVAMAQRLVRKLCRFCKQPHQPTAEEQAILDRISQHIVDQSLVPAQSTLFAANPNGCEKCGGRGYKGRTGVFEAIFMDKAVEDVLERRPSEREVWAAARAQAVPTMAEDGIIKILRGITDLAELGRVVDLNER